MNRIERVALLMYVTIVTPMIKVNILNNVIIIWINNHVDRIIIQLVMEIVHDVVVVPIRIVVALKVMLVLVVSSIEK